jgi:hypothetical protein
MLYVYVYAVAVHIAHAMLIHYSTSLCSVLSPYRVVQCFMAIVYVFVILTYSDSTFTDAQIPMTDTDQCLYAFLHINDINCFYTHYRGQQGTKAHQMSVRHGLC